MSVVKRTLLVLVTVTLFACLASAKNKPLVIYCIDVEGGQATLLVAPSGQSLLVDTGWPDFSGRDAARIASAAKDAGVSQIDYVLITHYHADHVGGVPQLARAINVGTFVDHGPNQEDTPAGRILFEAYQDVVAKHEHKVAKPSDRIPLKGLDVQVLTAP